MVLVLDGRTVDVDVEAEADNPGRRATHCRDSYHEASGMMTTLSCGT